MIKLIDGTQTGNTCQLEYTKATMPWIDWIEFDLYTSGLIFISADVSDVSKFFQIYLDKSVPPLLLQPDG